ncbi:MAG TPA: dTDP-glucose 4,6-dehydratase [Thermoplasmata archaeon]|nr:dTDP-glucose 4,6-dehydratase [Thermoplasmata archaeon]
MRVLVTGGAGFIGANLLYAWRERRPDDELRTLDALTYAGHLASIRPLLGAGGVRFLHGDIRDKTIVEDAMRDVELVVHLAAESHVDRSIDAPGGFVRTNVLGTQVLLEAARKADVGRFHHVSTDEVFGSLPIDRPDLKFTAETRYDPRSPYSASKAGSDHLVSAFFHTYGLKTTLSNCGNNYGPYQHPEKLIPLAITHLLRGEKVPVYGDGRNVRDWIHVRDHANAILEIALRGVPGRTYLVGAGQERSNLEVVRAVLAALELGEDRIEFVPDRPGHDRRYALDAQPLERELGWRPSVTFETGIRQTVEWYREQRAWWEPLLTKAAPASPVSNLDGPSGVDPAPR